MTSILGIDTGGTFTDAVLYDPAAGHVLAKAKAVTTRGDLAIGIGEAMAAVLAAGPGRGSAGGIGMVSVSTTLATNAIVEGEGGPIAVLLAGFDPAMVARTGLAAALPGTPVAAIAGGHDHAGEPLAALDRAAAEAFFRRHGPSVEAFAVAACYSVRNPAHELHLRALAARLTGRPVTLSSELAAALDAPRRALTAALNARLIGRIAALVAAIRQAMARLGLDAPLMIVRGDGSLAAADAVLARPIETILSGPAASVIGARHQSGLADFVMSDIGGTTTDIAVLEDGWPRLDRAGAEVGGFRTLVRAVEMRTYGLGGDSEVGFDASGALTIGPRRAVPLSLLAHRYPAVLARLAAAAGADEPSAQGWRWVLRPFGAAGPDADGAAALGERERALLDRIGAEPVPLAEIAADPRARRVLERLVAAGRVQIAGFTPTDAAHALGRQATWPTQAARLGAQAIAGARRMGRASAEEGLAFAAEVADGLARLSARAILETVARRPAGAADEIFDTVAEGRRAWRGLRVGLTPSLPVVAVGAPARLVYPEVGRRLGAEPVFVADGDVANALGAATGVVRGRAVVEVTTRPGGGWRIHHEHGVEDRDEAGAALAAARALAEDAARRAAAAFGAPDAAVAVRLERTDLPGVTGDAGLVAALVTAEATGRPAATAADALAAAK